MRQYAPKCYQSNPVKNLENMRPRFYKIRAGFHKKSYNIPRQFFLFEDLTWIHRVKRPTFLRRLYKQDLTRSYKIVFKFKC